MIRACATPPQKPAFKLPPRLARARRTMESKRLDTFRELHESLKKTGQRESDAAREFFKLTQDMWDEIKEIPDLEDAEEK